MVSFVGVKDVVAWLNSRGVERTMVELVDYLDADFRRWPQFDKSPRVAAHSAKGVIELMPTSDGELYSFKYVNGHPSNPSLGLQTVTAFGVLADVASGYPLLLAEMTVLTALRTAATSALAARNLARPRSQTLALIGAGSQAEFQALAFRGVLGINRLRVFDTDPAAVEKLQRNLAPLGFEIVEAADSTDAARGADIVTTCTADKKNAIVLSADAVEPGMHINAIGGDCPGKTELDPAILARARVFVEYPPQTRIEGEIQQMPADFPITELWQVIVGQAPGRTATTDVTVFDSVGFAIEDFSVLRFLRESIAGTPFVGNVDLVVEPDDPKDLFGLVTSNAPVPV
ncbi:MAG TPA: ornithine cyclodeaminase [Galbitalea sp.]|jgi:ornithine cyclodeaminase|nr:ornithine cyclodeaminase [Galbitalea sp.]